MEYPTITRCGRCGRERWSGPSPVCGLCHRIEESLAKQRAGKATLEHRDDGWPLCPICGEDELGAIGAVTTTRKLTMVEYQLHDLFCYGCGQTTVVAGWD